MKKILLIVLCVMLVCSFSFSFAATTPSKVTGLKASADKTYIAVKWNKAKNAKKYQVAYKKSTDKSYKTRTLTGTSTTIKGLKASSTYYLKVRSVNGNRYSAYTSVLKKTTLTTRAIPSGDTYYDYSEKKMVKFFPVTSEAGDKYTNSDYTYQCVGKSIRNNDIVLPAGWKVLRVSNRNKTSYGELLSTINGKPVVWLQETYWYCKKMKTAPAIPKTVNALTSTYDGCESLQAAPELPVGLILMTGAFSDCTSLKQAPVIPASVIQMDFSFVYCPSLQGNIYVNANLDNIGQCYSWIDCHESWKDGQDLTTTITIKGNCDEKTCELLRQGNSYVKCGH